MANHRSTNITMNGRYPMLLMLIAASTGVAAETRLPGRLFLTPAQRQAIDQARQNQASDNEEAVPRPNASFKGEIRSQRRHLRWHDDTGWQPVQAEDEPNLPNPERPPEK